MKPQGSMDCLRDFVFEKLGEAFSWVKSQLEAFFNFLSKKINESVDRARRFFDNFSEKFKQALIASKNFIDAAIHKIVKIMCSIERLMICSSVHTEKEKISLFVNMVSVLIKELKNLDGYKKSFSDYMKETEEKTNHRFKSSNDDDETFHGLYDLISGFFALLKILLHKRGRLPVILCGAILFYLREPNKDIAAMKSGGCFKDHLAEDEREAAIFVYVLLNEFSNLVKSMLATLLKLFL